MGEPEALRKPAEARSGRRLEPFEPLGDVVAWPALLLMKAATAVIGADAAFRWLGECLALLPGPVGVLARRRFYRRVLPRWGRNVTVNFGSILVHRSLEIEDDVYIGRYCLVGGDRIGRGAMLADYVRVVAGSHGIDAGSPIRYQPSTYWSVKIGEESWIATGAVVLADVGAGAVVGANSVVTRPIEDEMIAAGNPARDLHRRR